VFPSTAIAQPGQRFDASYAASGRVDEGLEDGEWLSVEH
jgi:hypothetical protein